MAVFVCVCVRMCVVVVVVDVVKMVCFCVWETRFDCLVTGQFGECRVHFIGKGLVSILVKSQFVYIPEENREKRKKIAKETPKRSVNFVVKPNRILLSAGIDDPKKKMTK